MSPGDPPEGPAASPPKDQAAAPPPADRLSGRLAALSPEQRALCEKLRRAQAPPPPRTPPPVSPVSGPLGLGDWPLTFDQERLWQLHRDRPGLISWNVDAGSWESRVSGSAVTWSRMRRKRASQRATVAASRMSALNSIEPEKPRSAKS